MGKRIALLHYTAPPVVGGVESVLAQHAALLADAGHAVRVLAGRGQAWRPGIVFDLLPLADSRHPDVVAAKGELDAGRVPPDFDALTDQLVQALLTTAGNCDLLIAHNVCSLNKNLPLTAALYRLSARPGFPRLVLWHHDLAWTTPRFAAELHPGYPWDLLRTHWPGVTQVVVSAERQRELATLLGLAPESIRVVPNGVDASRFLKLEPQTETLARELGLLRAAPLLLLPVRITPRKNIELALRTLAALRLHNGLDARLVVTGPLGPHSPGNADYFVRLRALRATLGLDDSFHFLAEHTEAYLPDAIVADFFRLADALFLPSREEGFGIPLLEAAFSRRPVFCADIPALRELGQSEAVYFSPDADPAEIAALVATRLLADRVYRFAARARMGYSWEQIYTRHLEPLLREAGE
jgi:glycosyltransferase involved in cell wall biosynthesis